MNTIEEMRANRDDMLGMIEQCREKQRNKDIAAKAIMGETLSDIGSDFGLSVERVRQIVHQVARTALNDADRRDAGAAIFSRLSFRARRALENDGMETDAAVRARWKQSGQEYFVRLPNFGRKSLVEVAQAFGFKISLDIDRPVSRGEYEYALRLVRACEEQNKPKT